MSRFLSLLPAVALVAACGAPPMAPVMVPLNYKMMADAVEVPVLQPCAGVSSIEVVDSRSDKTIGKRYNQENRDETYPVTASGDIATWTRAGVEEIVRRAQVNTSAADRPSLVISLEQVVAEESVYRRAEYDVRVIMTAELRSRGRSCWKQRVDGFAENYGYAGSAENYQETLNHALDRAVIRMLNATGFKEAVCGECSES